MSFLNEIRQRFGVMAPNAERPLRNPAQRAAVSFATSLEFDGIGKQFDEIQAVDHVSFQVEAGEIVCLLGPSGCGKTTLLRLASGIDAPTSGRVLLGNQEVAGPGVFLEPNRRNIGLMFQDFALFPHLTVIQNVAYGLKRLGSNLAAEEAFALLARVGLERYANSYPHTLSGGQQQRVALARAIAPRPAVLLMDEPFSGLDVYLREVLCQTTRELLKETRSTSLIVTHDPDEAMRLADRIAVMRDGKLVQIGSAEHLYHKPADLFVARLFSEINEVPATVSNGIVETPFGQFDASGHADGQSVVLGVRRRAVRPAKNNEGVPGRVLSSRFQGDLAQLTIAIAGTDKPLTSLVREARAPSPGDDVSILVDQDGILIFDQESMG
ncbi:MAG: ABC transporter ATP-binding protein [Pseudomonadota bacterium]